MEEEEKIEKRGRIDIKEKGREGKMEKVGEIDIKERGRGGKDRERG